MDKRKLAGKRKKTVVNPCLPLWEHVPDYVCWSAPADDLSAWR